METLWQMLSGTDDETVRILDEVIILFVHANPDGHDLVADWYMRNPEPTKRSLAGLRLALGGGQHVSGRARHGQRGGLLLQ
jgi:hypothetical protein